MNPGYLQGQKITGACGKNVNKMGVITLEINSWGQILSTNGKVNFWPWSLQQTISYSERSAKLMKWHKMEKKTHLKIRSHTNQYREYVYLSSKLRLICDFLRYIDRSVSAGWLWHKFIFDQLVKGKISCNRITSKVQLPLDIRET